jgi:hypothetical protein
MWSGRLRTNIMTMNNLLSQPFAAAQADAAVRAGARRLLGRRFHRPRPAGA